ncbi:hypothetical protein Rifp1Sym_dk00110 [endosymbiont of Riftia pachyptila (vent Ph05)]|uniref:Uncharacterized protein n=2 Tax=endosymbiont of Riftia pachyptila TaxID=54396 RepID=G2DGD5_9GAMM|nr:hypothetical protein Rifp1Sym_dk00110 [endosymbiont of Riftia pachyptila (vent Ph05)]
MSYLNLTNLIRQWETVMKKLSGALLATAGFLFAFAVEARPVWQDDKIDVEIVSDYGQEFPKYEIDNDRKTHRAYLEARKGKNYTIRVTNNSDERIGLVITVDGRNIISGKKSNLKPHERMYVLGPYQQAKYEGWRTSKKRVNRFYFTSIDDSYADAWGDRTAMGVIAVAVFKGKKPDITYDNYPRRQEKRRALRRSGADTLETAPGTGFGESEYSPVRTVHFKPRSKASEKHFIKYEWRRTLCSKGVIDCQITHNRFWPDEWDSGFAPFPPGRGGF